MRTTSYRFLAVLLLTCWLTCGLTGCHPDSNRELRVFAAASLGEVVGELARAYRQRYPETAVSINLAGSNVLARQIADGAAADLFFSANTGWMDHLEQNLRLVPGSRTPLLKNRLVVVAARGTGWSLDQIQQLPDLGFRYLAVANPEAVPGGIYAREYLASVGYGSSDLWQELADRIAPAADVRRALAMAQADPTVIAMVYATDVPAAANIRVLFTVPENAVQIRYEAALVRGSETVDDAERFLRFLSEPTAMAIYRRYGFGVTSSSSSNN